VIVGTVVISGCGTPGTTSASSSDVKGVVDVGGGRQIYVECRGEGSPTAVLIAGKGNGADDWMQLLRPDDPVHEARGDDLPLGGELVHSAEAVFPQVAQFTRVCTYDRPNVRAGADTTTPRDQPHTVDADVNDLAALFDAIGETGPKVLVAHSYGGVIALLYARTHPADVAGLVIVDALTDDIAEVAEPDALAYWDRTNAMTSDQVREGVRVIDAVRQIEAAPQLRAMPTIVLVSDKPWRADLLPADVRDKGISFTNWTDHLARFATGNNARLITNTHSGHDIHLYNPSLVVDEIRSVVGDVREGTAR
jgi:pimeloyl-ACP methyl ester carboxylesterase